MSSRVVGIDLGTLNSCVAAVRDGKAVVLADDSRTTVPSCVALQGEKELVGAPAKRHAVTSPESTIIAVKRLLGHPYDSDEVRAAAERVPYPIKPSPLGSVLLEVGGRELTPVQVSARILQRIREVAEAALGGPVKRAVISVPAHFNDIQRKATKLAAEYAGLEVMRLINEPTAAAFAYGYKKGRNFNLAVYDLGGGTFDVTVMEAVGDCFSVVATDGDSYLGGEDFDFELAGWLEAEFEAEFGHSLADDNAARLRIKEAAEKAKIELSQVEQTAVDLPFLTQLPSGDRPHFNRTVSRAKLNELVDPLVKRTLELCERCMQEASCGPIDEVLLVGGASRMPCVREAVADFFGKEPRRDINPDEVVAIGAALYAYSLVADELKDEAEDAAEEAYAVARKGVDVARKLVDEVSKASDPGRDNSGLADRLRELLAQTGVSEEEDDTPKPRPKRRDDEDLPEAAKAVRDELFALDYKACEVIEKLSANLPEEAESTDVEEKNTLPRLLEEARAKISKTIESAKSASEKVGGHVQEAKVHAKARKVTLNDVTSLPLGIASAGDVFTVLIAQNERVPVEHQRRFTTSQDGQTEVEIRAFQGRGRHCAENDFLGAFTLCGIEPAPRMSPKLEVAFRIDENGILSVRARDAETGAQQGMKIDDPLEFDQLPPDLDQPGQPKTEAKPGAAKPGPKPAAKAAPAKAAPAAVDIGEVDQKDIEEAIADFSDFEMDDEEFDNTKTGARELDFDD